MKAIATLKYWEIIRQTMAELRFPGTEESVSYGTPSFKVKTALLCRLWEDGETLVIHTDDRDEWTKGDKEDVFYVTEHYANYPYVLVRLKKIKKKKLKELLMKSWKEIATPKLLAEWEKTQNSSKKA